MEFGFSLPYTEATSVLPMLRLVPGCSGGYVRIWPMKSKKRFEYCSGFTVEISAPACPLEREGRLMQCVRFPPRRRLGIHSHSQLQLKMNPMIFRTLQSLLSCDSKPHGYCGQRVLLSWNMRLGWLAGVLWQLRIPIASATFGTFHETERFVQLIPKPLGTTVSRRWAVGS